MRNTRVVDVVRELQGFGARVDVYDPWASADAVHEEYGIELLRGEPPRDTYDAIVVAVAHRQFRDMGSAAIKALGRKGHVLYDIKSLLPVGEVDARL